MKDITAITILENMSMWSMLNADEYHALKMGIEALRTKAKEQAAIDTALKNIKAEIEREGEMYPDGDWYISIDRVCEIIDKHTSRK